MGLSGGEETDRQVENREVGQCCNQHRNLRQLCRDIPRRSDETATERGVSGNNIPLGDGVRRVRRWGVEG